jgi:pyridoxal phosphate enzyme (YggS family)
MDYERNRRQPASRPGPDCQGSSGCRPFAGKRRLLAVSKTWPLACVLDAADAGQRAFGENYVQEGIDKIAAVSTATWNGISSARCRATSRPVAEHFDWVHSIDRLKIAERLSAQRPAYLPPLQVCVQVNVSGEASKSGCAPDEALALCRAVAALPGLQLRGLMAIPEPADDLAAQRAPFRACAKFTNTSGRPACRSIPCPWACPTILKLPLPKARPSSASARPFLVKEVKFLSSRLLATGSPCVESVVTL